LWREVLPHVGRAAPPEGAGSPAIVLALARLGVFFDAVFPLLTAVGWIALRDAEPHARRVITAAIVAGCALAIFRFVVPALLRDAKEVEMLVAPVAVAASAALAHGWSRGGPARAAAAVAALAALGWGAWQSGLMYADRFWSVGR
jgi:hypothetical protein